MARLVNPRENAEIFKFRKSYKGAIVESFNLCPLHYSFIESIFFIWAINVCGKGKGEFKNYKDKVLNWTYKNINFVYIQMQISLYLFQIKYSYCSYNSVINLTIFSNKI